MHHLWLTDAHTQDLREVDHRSIAVAVDLSARSAVGTHPTLAKVINQIALFPLSFPPTSGPPSVNPLARTLPQQSSSIAAASDRHRSTPSG
jgi:hypothetical protein